MEMQGGIMSVISEDVNPRNLPYFHRILGIIIAVGVFIGFVLVAVITKITAKSTFSYSGEKYGITYFLPKGLTETFGDENFRYYPSIYSTPDEFNGVIYGYNKKGNYYRLMWMSYPFAATADEETVLKAVRSLLQKNDESTKLLLPFFNIPRGSEIALNKKKDLDIRKLALNNSIFPNAPHSSVITCKVVYKALNKKKIYSDSTIWYCKKTKRLFALSRESYTQFYSGDTELIQMPVMTGCHPKDAK
jgi:hypothetical protein